MHNVAVALMFCSATCGIAREPGCSAGNDWKPTFLVGDSDECKSALQSHCDDKSARKTAKNAKEEAKGKKKAAKDEVKAATGKEAKDKAKEEKKDAKAELKASKKKLREARQTVKDSKNKIDVACWSDWLIEVPEEGQCVNKEDDVINAGLSVTVTREECIQMLVDSPMAIGFSYYTYPSQPTRIGRCRVLYENGMGHIDTEDASGEAGFQCYARRSMLEKPPVVTTVDDVSLEEVGTGFCFNAKMEAGYHGTTTSKHILTSRSTCFQMFEDALPEAVGMYFYKPSETDSRCRVLYDRSHIGEITQSNNDERYTCYKRSTPADNRRLRAADELPLV